MTLKNYNNNYLWDILFGDKGSYFDYDTYFQSVFRRVEKNIVNPPKSNMQFFLSTADITEDAATYKFAIPNLDKSTVSVNLSPGKAVLKYKVRSLNSDESSDEQTHKINVPDDLAPDTAKLEYIDGVLILTFNRTKQDTVTVKLPN